MTLPPSASAVLLCVLGAALTLGAGATPTPVFPWPTVQALGRAATEGDQTACPDGTVFRVRAEDGTDVWMVWLAAETQRAVGARWPGAATGAPATVVVLTITGDRLVVTDTHPFDPARDGEGPCAHLYPTKE